MSKAEESTLSEKTSEAGERLTEGSGLRDVASRVVQDGKTVAQRWGRQSLSAAEDFADNATDHIKHDPVRAAAISFVIGLGLGVLVAWGSTRHQSD